MTTFRGAILSDYRFDDLVYSIEYNQGSLAYITQENGCLNPRIAFVQPYLVEDWNLPLQETIEFLEYGKETLFKFRNLEATSIKKSKVKRFLFVLDALHYLNGFVSIQDDVFPLYPK